MRAEKEGRLDKVVSQLYSEKRTVFRGWLKAVFVGQAILGIVLSGFAAYDAFPWWNLDLSIRALGFWAYWLFIIPSLRARRPRGWEKKALNVAFIGSPILTLVSPFVVQDPPTIWAANLMLLVGCYAYGLASGDGETEVSGFSGPLKWLDFGSGQERGVRGAARERLFTQDGGQSDEAEVDDD